MSNTSATGGYLAPAVSPAPLEGVPFEDFLQEVIVGISGLTATLVRPRWQIESINLPAVGTDWASFGITDVLPDTFAVEFHDPIGNSRQQRHEIVNILTSWYGPNAFKYMALFRDGLQIAQNREVLTSAGMGLVETGRATQVPSLVKEKFLIRVDLPLTIRREIERVYPVLNLLSAYATTYIEDRRIVQNIIVQN